MTRFSPHRTWPRWGVFALCAVAVACDSLSDSKPWKPPAAGGSTSFSDPAPNGGTTFSVGGALSFPSPTFEPEECDLVQAEASVIEEGARFVGFFQAGIVGQLASGAFFLLFWPEVGFYRMPEADLDFAFMSYNSGHALACAPDSCAIFALGASGEFERIPGGTVPGGAGFTSLWWEDYLLCVSGEGESDRCFDRVTWTSRDGGAVTLPDAGSDASAPSDAGRMRVPPDASRWAQECDAPIYCDAEELADDPFCLYDINESWDTISGVTRAGRMVEGPYDGTGEARCSVKSPPFGPPIGLARSSCGILDHIVLLTADGMFETCGCAYD